MFNRTLNQIAKDFNESRISVVRRINRGELKYGVHYIDIRSPQSRNAKYRFNLEALKTFFSVPPEKR
jgi:hypothetical protein